MTAYILTADAESDLRSVIRYTHAQWGTAQVRRYISGFGARHCESCRGEGPFKDMSALHPALRMARCEHHYVFCLLRENAPALIVAIFHEGVDLMKRLAGRLNE